MIIDADQPDRMSGLHLSLSLDKISKQKSNQIKKCSRIPITTITKPPKRKKRLLIHGSELQR
jgi:hypothetical protein